jgi:hypothetical protein
MNIKGKSLLALLVVVIVMMSSCAAPVAVSTPTPIDTPTKIPTSTTTPISTPTITPTPTASLTLTETPTAEPALYCSDKIQGCYFIGSEISSFFALMTFPCFENGGSCYPPVDDCSLLSPRVVHVEITDLALAWESEVKGNPLYKDVLNPKLYDPLKHYCFVDEGIAQLARDAGSTEYVSNKSCLNNEKVPCDVVLRFYKIDYVACGLCKVSGLKAFFTEKNFLLGATWASDPIPEMDLMKVMNGEAVRDVSIFEFAYVFVSSAAGFDNKNPPLGIYMVPHR